MKKPLTSTQKLAKFAREARKLEALAGELGMISISGAAGIKGTSRSAVTQLITRGRLNVVYAFGYPHILREQVENFQAEKPGPKITCACEPNQMCRICA